MFQFKDPNSQKKYSFLNHTDGAYSGFMIQLFQYLNPRYIKYKEDIFYELDEIDAFIFVQDGSYKIGYKMNYKTKFRLINGSGSYIGGFEVTFDRQSSYDYQGLKPMNVFYIR